jgi:hypothetical protein
MFIRYFGNGIGHQTTNQTTNAGDMDVDAEDETDPVAMDDEDEIPQDLDDAALASDISDDQRDASNGRSSESDGGNSDSDAGSSDGGYNARGVYFGPEDESDVEDDEFGSF